MPNTMTLFEKPSIAIATKNPGASSSRKTTSLQKSFLGSSSSQPSDLDSSQEALQNSLAQHEAARSQSVIIKNKLPSSRRSEKSNSRLLTSASRSLGSQSTSTPSTTSITDSPTIGPTLSAAQQAMEKRKEQRVMFVHELAVQKQTADHLEERWTGTPEEFRATLKKVADFDDSSKTWSLVKTYWKELDVWKYPYDSQEQRQDAIENAIKQYDRMRLSPSQPEWERLLPFEERGKGKGRTLSALQSKLGSDFRRSQSKMMSGEVGSESAKSSSTATVTPAPKLPKKPSERESQAKRLLSKPKKPSSNASATTPVATTPTAATSSTNNGSTGTSSSSNSTSSSKAVPSSAKTKVVAAAAFAASDKRNTSKAALSAEYVEDSSDSEDQALASKAKAPTVSTTSPTPLSSSSSSSSSTLRAMKLKAPAATKVVKVESGGKRLRTEDDDSFSSGPLQNKRFKAKPAAEVSQGESSQLPRGAVSGTTWKAKNTSPAKSSPLALSTPSCGSDGDATDNTLPGSAMVGSSDRAAGRKRNREQEMEATRPKRARESTLSPELIHKAAKFKAFYEEYEALHYEIAALEEVPEDKMTSLLRMRRRLQKMKSAIYEEHESWSS